MDERRSSSKALSILENAIGPENTQTLIREIGGTRMFIPKRVTPRNKLVNMLGLSIVRQLSEQLGGTSLAVPRPPSSQKKNRNQEITRLYDSGVPVTELARRYHLTDRQIYTILSLPPEESHG